jgi:hypothetical protein
VRRKQKTFGLLVIGTPLAFGVPTILNNYFPNELIAFTKIAYLFPIIALLLCALRFFKRKNIGANESSKLNMLKIIAVLFFLLCALFGQAGILIQHAAGQGHIQTSAKAQYMLDIFHQLGWKSLLWPWAMLAVTTLSFIARSRTHPMQAFSAWLPPFRMPTLYRFLKKAADMYIEMCTRITICLALGIFIASLCLLVSHMSVRPMVGTLSFLFLLLMVYSKRFKTLENNITSFNVSPAAIFVCMMAFMFFIAMVVKLMIIVLLNHAAQQPIILTSHHTPLIIHKQTWLMSWHLWFWSWWVLATPIAASYIAKLTKHSRSFLTLLSIMACGVAITTLLTWLPHHTLLHLATLLINPAVSICLQGLSILGIFIIFASLKGHHIIWLGYAPKQSPKKMRVMKLRIIWALVAMGFGIMLLSGLQSILLIQMLVAIAAIIILLLTTTLSAV